MKRSKRHEHRVCFKVIHRTLGQNAPMVCWAQSTISPLLEHSFEFLPTQNDRQLMLSEH